MHNDWLPEEYKVPETAPSVVDTNSLSLDSQLGGNEFLIDEKTVGSILAETALCKKYFQAAAKNGYKRYVAKAAMQNGNFVGIKFELSK